MKSGKMGKMNMDGNQQKNTYDGSTDDFNYSPAKAGDYNYMDQIVKVTHLMGDHEDDNASSDESAY